MNFRITKAKYNCATNLIDIEYSGQYKNETIWIYNDLDKKTYKTQLNGNTLIPPQILPKSFYFIYLHELPWVKNHLASGFPSTNNDSAFKHSGSTETASLPISAKKASKAIRCCDSTISSRTSLGCLCRSISTTRPN